MKKKGFPGVLSKFIPWHLTSARYCERSYGVTVGVKRVIQVTPAVTPGCGEDCRCRERRQWREAPELATSPEAMIKFRQHTSGELCNLLILLIQSEALRTPPHFSPVVAQGQAISPQRSTSA